MGCPCRNRQKTANTSVNQDPGAAQRMYEESIAMTAAQKAAAEQQQTVGASK